MSPRALGTLRKVDVDEVPAGEHWEVRVEDAAPRTLVKIYWPLERD